MTRTIAPKEAMLRFVAGEGRILVPDLEARLPGRGIWLSARGDVIEAARASGQLGRTVARVAGGPVTIADDLLVQLQEELVRRIVGLLGLARRAGQAVAGWEAVGAWRPPGRVEGRVGVCPDAGDAGLPGARLPGESEPLPLRVRADVLAEVFGADARGPVFVRPGRLAAAVRCEMERLVGLGLDWSKVGEDERVHDGRQ
ncbi:MAG: DUF448 domain-containing protein [Acetobacteraceae bacterium]